MKKYEFNGIEYELIKDDAQIFDANDISSLITDYFKDFDYIFGDIAYNKLRLKGFYDQKNKKVKPINNYNNLEVYLKENCAVDCKYFILKKVEEKDEK